MAASEEEQVTASEEEQNDELTEQQVIDMKRSFDNYDKNQDGKLDVQELVGLAKDIGGDATEGQAKAWIQSVDYEGKGYLEFAQFVMLMKRIVSPTRENDAYFDMFDKNKDNFISKDEMKTTMEEMGAEVDESVMEFFNAADKDGDGKLSRKEFQDAHAE